MQHEVDKVVQGHRTNAPVSTLTLNPGCPLQTKPFLCFLFSDQKPILKVHTPR